MPFANDVTMPVGAVTVTISTVAGEVPVLPAPGVAGVPADPRSGDFFINRTDNLTWVYAPDPANPGDFIWEPLQNTITRGSVVYVGSAAFDPTNIGPPLYGMSADTMPLPSTTEPFGGDWYISTDAGDITLLAGPPPPPIQVVAQQGRPQHLFVGPGPMVAPFTAANNWGFAPGTQPTGIEPFPGDLYFDTVSGDVSVLS